MGELSLLWGSMMEITLNLDATVLETLKNFLHDNPTVHNEQEALLYLIHKSLQDLGYIARQPGVGTSPDKLNSSNDD